MASSSKRSNYVDQELISPLEHFTWTEDDSITQRRLRRAKASRLMVGASVVSAVAFVMMLYEGGIIAFGPLATAASISPW